MKASRHNLKTMDLRCGNPSCDLEFGPAVGHLTIVSVGRRLLALEGVLAIECERCHHLTGKKPEARHNATAILCPGCQHKCGEDFRDFYVFSSGGRTVYARRVQRIQCGRCDRDFDPAERADLPPAIAPTSRRKRANNGLSRAVAALTSGAPITRTIGGAYGG